MPGLMADAQPCFSKYTRYLTNLSTKTALVTYRTLSTNYIRQRLNRVASFTIEIMIAKQ